MLASHNLQLHKQTGSSIATNGWQIENLLSTVSKAVNFADPSRTHHLLCGGIERQLEPQRFMDFNILTVLADVSIQQSGF
jgi:hypothetical protein